MIDQMYIYKTDMWVEAGKAADITLHGAGSEDIDVFLLHEGHI